MILYEDEDVLAVDKPAGWNTHVPDPYAPAGVYEWLRAREPRWADLTIMHRLDKETSGILLFAKSPRARQSLSRQFAERGVGKTYEFLTDRPVPENDWVRRSLIGRKGDRYREFPEGKVPPQPKGAQVAVTRFQKVGERVDAALARGGSPGGSRVTLVQARPETGRTHQIRVHAAASGCPVLGDSLYGGAAAPRLCLHAAGLRFVHPATGEPMEIRTETDFAADPAEGLRRAVVDREDTDAYRMLNGAADGWPGWSVDRLGAYLMSQAGEPLSGDRVKHLETLASTAGAKGTYHKTLTTAVRNVSPSEASPALVRGQAAPPEFVVRENGVLYALSFEEGYSTGLFLDQRDNRRRLSVDYVGPGFRPFSGTPIGAEVLNVFAYTCGFSVCAAKAGAKTTSLDLSRKYLEWGRRNFVLNGLDPRDHDFIYGDAFDWMRRLAHKGRQYDVVLLDPPTFSTSKPGGAFRAEKDYDALVDAALPLVKKGGVLFASTNAARISPERFAVTMETAAARAGRTIERSFFASQSPDFPPSRREPAYLKTFWLRVG